MVGVFVDSGRGIVNSKEAVDGPDPVLVLGKN